MKNRNIFDELKERGPIFFIIDGSSFIYRAFYAYQDLKTSWGFPTNAIYILLRLILKIVHEKKPQYACFVIDGKGPTFRHNIDSEYKANRLKMPEPLSMQLPVILQGVNLLGIKTVIAQDFEADDYIASMCERLKTKYPVVIVGSDKDLFQLLSDNVIIWDPSGKNEKIITYEDFVKEKGFDPKLWPLYQALVGDNIDNIKGVPGIGPKSAINIVKRFSTIDDIFNNLDKLPSSFHKKLKGQIENVKKYLKLTTLKKDISIEEDLEDFKVKNLSTSQLKAFFEKYEFKSLLREIHADKNTSENREVLQATKKIKEAATLQEILKYFQGKDLGIYGKDDVIAGDGDREFKISKKDHIIEIIKNSKISFVPSLKELLYLLEDQEVSLENIYDLSLCAYLIDPEMRNYSIENILSKFQINSVVQMRSGALIDVGRYLIDLLEQNQLLHLYEDIERPIVPILIQMEKHGIKIDKEKFRQFLDEVSEQLEILTRNIYHHAGTEFNIRSSKQLSEILFNKLGLKSKKKTPKGELSTSMEVLESIKDQHPIVKDILSYRRLEKLRSTYLIPLPKLADKNDRIHTTFNQLATATGRLSSSDPNLQNIPIRGDLGYKMRSCFIAEKSHVLISADYSQVELRVLAHFSKDEYLLEAFSKNMDIHTCTAAALFDKDPEDVTSDERRKAKTINFGLIYGMGPLKLSRELEISMTEAKQFIEKYFSKLTGVKKFYERVEQDAKTHEYVVTLAGRRRLLPHINSKNQNLASQAKRMAINTVIQGSAADIIKMAMIEVANNEKLKELGAKLILQIHDELLFECSDKNAKKAGEIVKKIMSNVVELDVPLVVDLGIGQNWAQAH